MIYTTSRLFASNAFYYTVATICETTFAAKNMSINQLKPMTHWKPAIDPADESWEPCTLPGVARERRKTARKVKHSKVPTLHGKTYCPENKTTSLKLPFMQKPKTSGSSNLEDDIATAQPSSLSKSIDLANRTMLKWKSLFARTLEVVAWEKADLLYVGPFQGIYSVKLLKIHSEFSKSIRRYCSGISLNWGKPIGKHPFQERSIQIRCFYSTA